MAFYTATVMAWLAFPGLGCYISLQTGRPVPEGLTLGLLFGPLGCLVSSLLPRDPAKARFAPDGGVVALIVFIYVILLIIVATIVSSVPGPK